MREERGQGRGRTVSLGKRIPDPPQRAFDGPQLLPHDPPKPAVSTFQLARGEPSAGSGEAERLAQLSGQPTHSVRIAPTPASRSWRDACEARATRWNVEISVGLPHRRFSDAFPSSACSMDLPQTPCLALGLRSGGSGTGKLIQDRERW